ncbi:hypothetical protein ACWDTT_15835 [Streptosporangium sandarakinum]
MSEYLFTIESRELGFYGDTETLTLGHYSEPARAKAVFSEHLKKIGVEVVVSDHSSLGEQLFCEHMAEKYPEDRVRVAADGLLAYHGRTELGVYAYPLNPEELAYRRGRLAAEVV